MGGLLARRAWSNFYAVCISAYCWLRRYVTQRLQLCGCARCTLDINVTVNTALCRALTGPLWMERLAHRAGSIHPLGPHPQYSHRHHPHPPHSHPRHPHPAHPNRPCLCWRIHSLQLPSSSSLPPSETDPPAVKPELRHM